MNSLLSVEDGPFPVVVLDSDGNIVETNSAWRAVALSSNDPAEALGLVGTDAEDFVDVVRAVVQDRESAWIDLDAHVLAERRWSRCHVWPGKDGRVIAAVVSLRETRDIELSRVDTEHIERILEHTADAITILDENMVFRFASGIATRWLGVSGVAFEGEAALSFVFADDHQVLFDAFASCIENPLMSIKARFRAVHESGDLIWVEGIGTNMFDDPAIRGILVTLNDITELVETRAQAETASAALAIEKQRYETLAQFTPTGVFELNGDYELTFHNERFQELLGLSDPSDFDWDLFDSRDRDGLRAALARSSTGTTAQSTVRLARPDPITGQQWLTFRAVRQDDDRIFGSVEDATTQIVKQAELAHRADHDLLTGLPNRENLLEQLEEFTASDEDIAVLFLDLDNFKDINDGLGHQVGDQVLVEIAERIRSVVRPNDLVGRLHGDEFLVVCRYTSDIQIASEIASRVVAAVGEPLTTASQQLFVSGSVGIAMNGISETEPTTPEQLLVAADVAMYEAKRRGGSRSVPFNTTLGKKAADRLRLHGEVQRAAEYNELELHYQPIIDLSTGREDRAEALIRWHHPTQGFILPERFIPEIEKSELIDQLGMWVIERVVADAALSARRPRRFNVNVSPRQLADPGFGASTLELLDTYGVDGNRLTLEITELVMMEDFDPVEEQLHLLRKHGVGIAIDDFGTGYSALAYLQRFPFDQVKIDGVFIEHIDTNDNDQAIVGSMIDLVKSLGSSPIAEKVERQAQANLLLELGCPLAQGFLLGLPAPLETAVAS